MDITIDKIVINKKTGHMCVEYDDGWIETYKTNIVVNTEDEIALQTEEKN